jgi:DNA-directed RNA polymerase subunit RPC12/RpoP
VELLALMAPMTQDLFALKFLLHHEKQSSFEYNCKVSAVKIMGRYCAECDEWCGCSQFSRNQWMKGDGCSRCKACVGGYQNPTYQCGECYREFNCQNELNMHMQVHRPRNVACPICGEQRFRTGANAVQHVESGYCTGCRGQDNAGRIV